MAAVNAVATATEEKPEIVFRATRRQYLPPAIILFIPFLAYAAASLQVHRWSPSLGFFPGGLWIFLALEVSLIQYRQRTKLTAQALDIRAGRRRVIPWSTIAMIRIERSFGVDLIAVYEASGRRTKLRAPTTGFLSRDPRFIEKYNVIGTWWTELHGPGTVAVPQATPGVRVKNGVTRIRIAQAQLWPLAALLLWITGDFVLNATVAATAGSPAEPAAARIGAGVAAVAVLLSAQRLCLHQSVRIEGDHLDVRGVFRRRSVAAGDVRDVTVVRRRGGWRVAVQFDEGVRVLLPTPRIGVLMWDAAFAERAREVRDWWVGLEQDPRDGVVAEGRAAGEPDETEAGEAEANGAWYPAGIRTGPRFWQQALVFVECIAGAYMAIVGTIVAVLIAG